MKTVSSFPTRIFVCALLSSLFLSACGIRPAAWQPSPPPAFAGKTQLNSALVQAQKIRLDGWCGPEDIVFDSLGNLYCGVHRSAKNFADGRILKIDPAGKVEEYYQAGSWVAGLHFDAHGNLLALSHRQGLISISQQKQVTVLASADADGRPFMIPNGLDVASDGKIYFTNTSDQAPYTIKYGRKIILELRPLGGLYCYDPQKKAVKTLINGTYFGNGVVLSKDESYLLMVETTRYRVLRYWLTGPKAGQVDTFVDNLPGFPNGISIRQDGSYWLGFSTKRNAALDNIHPKPGMKKFVYALPNAVQPQPEKFGMVMNIAPTGEILSALFDPTGAIFPEAGAVKEQAGYLYLGGDILPYIGKYKLE